MRRWTVQFLVCLVLGTVTTLGVAWGLALSKPMLLVVNYSGTYGPRPEIQPRWVVREHRERGALRLKFYAIDVAPMRKIAEVEVPAWSMATRPPPFTEARRIPGLGFQEVTEYAWGWPLLSLYYRTGYGVAVNEHRIRTPRWAYRVTKGRPLPGGIIWPGLLANSGLFAGGWFVLLLAPGMLRRSLRHRRGRCLSCGYDLQGHSGGGGGCPECGRGREAGA